MQRPGDQLCQRHRVEYGLFTEVVVKNSLSDAGPAHQRVRVFLKLLIEENESANETEREDRHELGIE